MFHLMCVFQDDASVRVCSHLAIKITIPKLIATSHHLLRTVPVYIWAWQEKQKWVRRLKMILMSSFVHSCGRMRVYENLQKCNYLLSEDIFIFVTTRPYYIVCSPVNKSNIVKSTVILCASSSSKSIIKYSTHDLGGGVAASARSLMSNHISSLFSNQCLHNGVSMSSESRPAPIQRHCCARSL